MTEAIKRVAGASWRTTLGAFLAMLVVIFQKGAIPFLDGIESTEPDMGLCLGAILGFVALWNARDHKVSSEQAGAKTQPEKAIK